MPPSLEVLYLPLPEATTEGAVGLPTGMRSSGH